MHKSVLVAQIIPTLKKALKLFKRADYQAAIQDYAEVLNTIDKESKGKQYENPAGLVSIRQYVKSLQGAAYMEKGEHELAMKQFTQILAENQFHVVTMLRRAKLYMKIGKLERSLEDVQYVHELEPDLDIESVLNDLETRLNDMDESFDNKYQLKKRLSDLRAYEQEQESVLLEFCNLKKIDRKSILTVKSTPPAAVGVCFGEDIVVEIPATEEEKNPITTSPSAVVQVPRASVRRMSREDKMKMLQTQQKEDHVADLQSLAVLSEIGLKVNSEMLGQENSKKLASKPRKSILKRPSQSYSVVVTSSQQCLTSKKLLNVLRINDIDGKFIQKSKSEIRFVRMDENRNSKLSNQSENAEEESGSKKMVESGDKPRKSILKQSLSLLAQPPSTVGSSKDQNRSSFFRLKNIEGRLSVNSFASSNQNKQHEPQDPKHKEDLSDSEPEDNEEFSIYGSKQQPPSVSPHIAKLLNASKGSESNRGSGASSRKSVLKPKNSIMMKKEQLQGGKRRTVGFTGMGQETM